MWPHRDPKRHRWVCFEPIYHQNAHQHMAKGEGSVRRTAWYGKTRPTSSDTLALVRRKLWAQEATFCGSVWEDETTKVSLRFIDRLTDTVCYAA